MEKNLFLTGPIGCGKSTAIAGALGMRLPKAGGFLTVRQKDETGQVAAFWLQKPDGSCRECIIDCSAHRNGIHMEVFENLGVQLLKEAEQLDFVILDEIGGFEVLSDAFLDALFALLHSATPCIGVMKGAAPAGKMIQKLGLGDRYIRRMEMLRHWMEQDENTLLYECGQFDPKGLELARTWVQKYCK